MVRIIDKFLYILTRNYILILSHLYFCFQFSFTQTKILDQQTVKQSVEQKYHCTTEDRLQLT